MGLFNANVKLENEQDPSLTSKLLRPCRGVILSIDTHDLYESETEIYEVQCHSTFIEMAVYDDAIKCITKLSPFNT